VKYWKSPRHEIWLRLLSGEDLSLIKIGLSLGLALVAMVAWTAISTSLFALIVVSVHLL
jgi:hypothetical protein